MSKRNYTAAKTTSFVRDQRSVFREITSGLIARLTTLEAEVKALRAELNAQNKRETQLVNSLDRMAKNLEVTDHAVASIRREKIKTEQKISGLEGKIKTSERTLKERIFEVLSFVTKLENKLR